MKDSSGSIAQSLDLLRQRPPGFAVLTGEDAFFYTMLAHGGDGGILASAHVETATFLSVYERMAANDHQGALKAWSRLEAMVPLLFKEPNPVPIKHCLWRQGLIASAECRLPLTRVSDALARDLDRLFRRRPPARAGARRPPAARAKGAQRMADKKDEQVVETATGLGYVDLVEGTGAQPKTGDTVSVHYTGWLKSGTKFDSSVDRGTPFEFPVGKGRVIKGWDEGVISMKVGGKRKLIIPAHLGYGDRGAGGVIPAGATLIFEVELLGIR